MKPIGVDANEQKARLAIARARWWLLDVNNADIVFYGTLATRLKDAFTATLPNDSPNETAATDGVHIFWNVDYVNGCSDSDTRGLLLHETIHPSHEHNWRLTPDLDGNIAGDEEANWLIFGIQERHNAIRAAQGKPPEVIISLPGKPHRSERFKGMACEEILTILKKERAQKAKEDKQNGKPSDGKGDDGGKQQPGGFIAPPQSSPSKPSDTPSDKPGQPSQSPAGSAQNPPQAQTPQSGKLQPTLQQQWQESVIQAVQACQALGRGNGPASAQSTLERVRAHKVDWKSETSEFARSTLATKNDWTRSARRHSWQKVIYPRKVVDAIGKLIFVRDTSGSISYAPNGTGAQFTAHITACIADLDCEAIVIDAGDNVDTERHLNPGDECPLDVVNGGGTDFRPVFERVQELVESGEHIAGVIYLTDLDGAFPDDCETPTLWIAIQGYRKEDAPFGRTLRIDHELGDVDDTP